MEPIWNVLCNHVVTKNINAIVMFTGETHSMRIEGPSMLVTDIEDEKCVGDSVSP